MKNKLFRCLTTVATVAILTTSMGINCEAASQPKLNKTKITLTEGKSYNLKVKGISSKVKVTWKTTKKAVATVSSKGKVKAKKKGTAVIKATFKYKKSGKKVTKTLKCKVTVKAKVKKATPTPKPTSTPKPTRVPTATPIPTVAPTATPTPEVVQATSTPTVTPEVVQATATPTPIEEITTPETPEVVVTATPTATPTVEPTATPEPTEVPVHVHDYNYKYEVVKESTCTEDGLINLYCECGEVYQRVICADHHKVTFVAGSWKETQPTETTDGYFGLHCNDCNTDVTFSERTTFPALTDENYPLDGWVYEKHDYDYDSLYYMSNHKVDKRHENPYIVVTDYIGSAEHPALKDKYTIDGVTYDVEIQGKLNITSPTVQSLRLYGMTWVNPDLTGLHSKNIITKKLGGTILMD